MKRLLLAFLVLCFYGFSVSISEATPTNIVAPEVTGTKKVGQTLTTTTGKWSNGGSVYTSLDALSWSGGSTGSSANLQSAVWSSSLSLFVTVGTDGAVLSSPDGATWTARTSETTKDLNDVVWSGTQFVAVGEDGVVITSSDGITWSANTPPTASDLNAITWNSTLALFVAVANGGLAFTSSDASSWTTRSTAVTGTTQDLNDVTSRGSTIVAVGNSGVIRYSANPAGANWSSPVTSATTNNLYAVATSSAPSPTTYFVAAGATGTIVTSTSLTGSGSWALATISSPSTTSDFQALASNSGSFVAVGKSGVLATATAANATTWTIGSSGTASKTLSDIVWSGSKFLTVDGGTTLTKDIRWYSCSQPNNTGTCTMISGATSTTFAIPSDNTYYGKYIRTLVTAGDGVNATAWSTAPSATDFIDGTLPVNKVAPTIDSLVSAPYPVGTTLIANPCPSAAIGNNYSCALDWDGIPAPSYNYQWQRFDNSQWTNIANATSSSYTLSGADYEKNVRVQITGVNNVGFAAALTSPTTGLVAGTSPVNTSAPTISGNAAVGEVVQATAGTWTNYPSPNGYTYQWQRSETGAADTWVAAGDPVDSAQATINYTTTKADAGLFLRLSVVAKGASVSPSEAAYSPSVQVGLPSCSTPVQESDFASLVTDNSLYGFAVKDGNTLRRFDVDIISVLDNQLLPGDKMFVAEVSGSLIDELGGQVLAGMAGAPVYRYSDEKLIGAISYGYPGSSSVYITPAVQMEDTGATSRGLPLTTAAESNDIRQIPLVFSTNAPFETTLSNQFRSRIGAIGGVVVPSVGGIASSSIDPVPDAEVRPGESLASVVATGRTSLAALGTTTRVCDKEILAYGHTLFSDPTGRAAAFKANVNGIIQTSSWGKAQVGDASEAVGSIDGGGTYGVQGTLGEITDTLDVKATIEDKGTKQKTTNTTITQIVKMQSGGSGLSQQFYTSYLPAMALQRETAALSGGRGVNSLGASSGGWTITGTDPAGEWQFTRNDAWSGNIMSASNALHFDLDTILNYARLNAGENVTLNSLNINLVNHPALRDLRLTSLSWRPVGADNWISNKKPVSLVIGRLFQVQLLLKQNNGNLLERIFTFKKTKPAGVISFAPALPENASAAASSFRKVLTALSPTATSYKMKTSGALLTKGTNKVYDRRVFGKASLTVAKAKPKPKPKPKPKG